MRMSELQVVDHRGLCRPQLLLELRLDRMNNPAMAANSCPLRAPGKFLLSGADDRMQ